MKNQLPFGTRHALEHIAADNANNSHDVALIKENEEEYGIEALIREKYSLSQEIAILRKVHLGKVSEEEFKEYSDYVEECIKKARKENGWT